MKVIVLGAGVIGVTTAYFLAKQGNQVTVLDKGDTSGLGCSYGNGAQLSYSHIETWAAKAFTLATFKEAILPSSFLSVSDFTNRKFLKWIFQHQVFPAVSCAK